MKMKNNYYCLVSGLPDVFFEDSKSPLALNDYREELIENLTTDDFSLISMHFLKYDNQNLLNFLRDDESELSPLGNFNRQDLEEIVAELKDDSDAADARIPDYFRTFVQAYTSDTPVFQGLSWENQLAWLYYDQALTVKNGFVRDWFEFEMNITNLLTAINCRKYELDIEEHIIGNNEVAKSIRQSNAKDFGISLLFDAYDEVHAISEETDIFNREQKIDLLKWKYLDEQSFFHYFSIEKLFAFLVKLEILQRWLQLSKENGEKIFRDMLKKLQTSYELPEEFIIKR